MVGERRDERPLRGRPALRDKNVSLVALVVMESELAVLDSHESVVLQWRVEVAHRLIAMTDTLVLLIQRGVD